MVIKDQKKNQNKRITAKRAAQIAAKYYREITKDSSSSLRVAEAELTENGRYWNITLAHPGQADPFSGLYGQKLEYKIFQIDAFSGEVRSMKIRKIE